MNNWEMLMRSEPGSTAAGPETTLLVLLLAFCIGHVIGWVYMWTHAGLSYSQMFVASLVILPPLVAFVMVLMAGDIVIAVGLMAVFAMVRFRNVLKDTRDATFVLWSIVQGMTVGSMRFSTSLIGCFCVAIIFIYLRVTSFGGRHRYDVILSLQAVGDGTVSSLRQILRRHSVRVQLASQRDLADHARDMSYRLLLRNPTRSGELLTELETAPGIAHVSLYHREDESEI
jgi:hypothetical protein